MRLGTDVILLPALEQAIRCSTSRSSQGTNKESARFHMSLKSFRLSCRESSFLIIVSCRRPIAGAPVTTRYSNRGTDACGVNTNSLRANPLIVYLLLG